MAVDFPQTPCLSLGSAILTETPISFVGRIRPNAFGSGAGYAIACINRAIGQGFVDDEHWVLQTFWSTGQLYAEATQLSGIPGSAVSPVGSVNIGSWNALVATFPSNSLRNLYVNNTTAYTNSTFIATPTVGDTQVGGRILGDSSVFIPMGGCMADVGVFNGSLNLLDINKYMLGFSATTLSSATLVSYLAMVNAATVGNAGVGGNYSQHGGGTFTDCSTNPPGPPPSRRFSAMIGPVRGRGTPIGSEPPVSDFDADDYFGGLLDDYL